MAYKVGGAKSGRGGGKGGGKTQGPRQPVSRREGSAGVSRSSSGPGYKTSGPRKPSGPKTGGKGAGKGFAGQPKPSGRSYSSEYDDLRETPRGRDSARVEWKDIPEFVSSKKVIGKGPGRGTAGGPARPAGKGYSREYDDLRERPKGRGTAGDTGRSFGKAAGKGAGYAEDKPSGRRGPSVGRPGGDYERGKGPLRKPEARQAGPGGPVRDRQVDRRAPRLIPPPEDDRTMPEGPDDKVMGVNPVLEMLRSGGRAVDSVHIDKDKGGPQFAQMISLARKAGITVKVVPREALDKLSGGMRHQGAIASVAPKEYADADGMVEASLGKGRPPLLVVLDGVEDPQNLGSIIRTAETAGADGVIIPEHRAAHLTASVARASAGALEHMPVAKVASLTGFLGTLKERGFWIVGLEAGTGNDYTGFGMDVPLAVVLGSEGGGVRPGVKKVCDALVSLPVLGKVSSLNVSVAAGIVLFEALRQRAKK